MLVKGEAGIGIASVPIVARGASAWAASRVTQIAHQYDCTRPAGRVTRIDGVTASELVYPDCFGYFDAIEAAHGGPGYDVYLLEPEKNAKDIETFRAAVASFRFG